MKYKQVIRKAENGDDESDFKKRHWLNKNCSRKLTMRNLEWISWYNWSNWSTIFMKSTRIMKNCFVKNPTRSVENRLVMNDSRHCFHDRNFADFDFQIFATIFYNYLNFSFSFIDCVDFFSRTILFEIRSEFCGVDFVLYISFFFATIFSIS